MSRKKMLTPKELAEIVSNVVNGDLIDCQDQYNCFIEGLGDLVTEHFGGDRGELDILDDEIGILVPIHYNELVPDDGGVYAKYDDSVPVDEWKGND